MPGIDTAVPALLAIADEARFRPQSRGRGL